MDHISSRQNTHFKLARKLAGSARERGKTDQILLDGTRLIGAYAAQCGLKESTLLISEKGFSRPEVQQILQSASPRHAFVLPEELFAEISQVETPEGIAAIVGIPRVEARLPDDFRIVLDGVQDPGNLGGLLRTAAAAGATSAHLAKGCADPWSPRSLRGGMGAQFVLPLRERIDIQLGLAGFNGEVIATSPRARQSIYELNLTGPVAMIFGSEGRGIADETLGLVSQLVHIPMTGMMESLNVAAAAAVCCFERLRQLERSRHS